MQYVYGYVNVELEDVAHYSSNKIDAQSLTEYTYVGVDNLLQNRQGKQKSSYVPNIGKCIEFNVGNILIGNIRPYLKKIWFANCDGGTNGDVLTIIANKNLVIPKYLFYVLSSDEFFEYDVQNSKGAKMPRGSKEMVLKYQFLLPSLQKQKEIVDILDNFDKLVNDLSNGLPAEIEVRQKQYEFYRDKLLNFKRKN